MRALGAEMSSVLNACWKPRNVGSGANALLPRSMACPLMRM